MIGIAISSSQITALTNRSKPRNLVLNEFKLNPNISVDEISSNTGNILNDTQAIILDLKSIEIGINLKCSMHFKVDKLMKFREYKIT